jgi:hypothetical protein
MTNPVSPGETISACLQNVMFIRNRRGSKWAEGCWSLSRVSVDDVMTDMGNTSMKEPTGTGDAIPREAESAEPSASERPPHLGCRRGLRLRRPGPGGIASLCRNGSEEPIQPPFPASLL